MEDFVHLHVHTQYSILDGQAAIPKLIAKALGDGMRAMAVTDHGNMMGIKEFYNAAEKARSKADAKLKELREAPEGETAEARTKREARLAELERQAAFKPILGCEMYVARRGAACKEQREDQGGNHLIVLAKNLQGYHNLVKLVSAAWVDGFYMRPRTDHEMLRKYHEGLIVCSACIAGEVPEKILKGDDAGAEQAALWFKEVFGDDYYLELQRHEVTDPAQRANRETFPLQQKANAVILQIARKHSIKVVCTNDSHFVDQENAEAHDRLICLSTGKDLDDPKRLLYTKQEWFKTRTEMNGVFADLPEALKNTCEIADKVELYSIDHAPIMPNFAIPESFGSEADYRNRFTEEQLLKEFTTDENGQPIMSDEEARKKVETMGGYDRLYRIKFEADYLAQLTEAGARRRYGDPVPKEVEERIRFELHVMKTMGFPGYFLIVQDYINVARNELGVSVGPGRGSAAGSCVAYCLGITQIDPIKYDLLFERFLNPDRISLPDIDVDFDDDGRGKVLDWVTQKYGAANCAHIITYGTMATKLAIKDVARVERLPLQESNRLCKLIPDKLPEGSDGKTPPLNLENAIKAIPELQQAEASPDPKLRDTIRYAKMLEGNVRNTGVHACGFIICRDRIDDWVPISTALDKESGQKMNCTQYEGSVIEQTGLIKMDFLSLKNLSIIKETLENIRQSLGVELDIDRIPLDDAATYQLFGEGWTIGTFQFESNGMQQHLRDLRPTCLEDLIAMNALYRPGPMAYIPQFIQRKKGLEPITYDLPCMEKYLKETYGITVYQEQVMLLSREIANFTRGESDTLRKAMGKKLKDKLNEMYPKFIAGGKANGYDEKILEKIWNDWSAFASYAFNKSHAACYAWVAYQTGYLKANYPAQYMAGSMSRSLNNLSEITKLMDESKAIGIKTLGPDINESRRKFSVNHLSDIRFGLGGVKGVGEAAVDAILRERDAGGPFRDVYNLVERLDLSACNKKTLESLATAGAFDSFGLPREAYVLPYGEHGETFLDFLMRYAAQYQSEKAQATNSLFGGFDAVEISHPAPPTDFEPWSDMERLNKERELIGIYISGHPLDPYRVIMEKVCNVSVTQLEELAPLAGKDLMLGGIVSAVKEGQTKNGKPFGRVRIEDYLGNGELALFGNDWATWGGYLAPGNAVFVQGTVRPRRYNEKIFDFQISGVRFLADVADTLIRSVTLTVRLDETDEVTATELISLLRQKKGKADLYLKLVDAEAGRHVTVLSRRAKVNLDAALVSFINDTDGLSYSIN